MAMDPRSFSFQAPQPKEGVPAALAVSGALSALFIAAVVFRMNPVALVQRALNEPDGLEYAAGAFVAFAFNGASLLLILGIWMLKRLALYGYGAVTALTLGGMAMASVDAVMLAAFVICRFPVLIVGVAYHRRFT